MPNILLLAGEARGARLKSDLEYIGHTVQHHALEGLPPSLKDAELRVSDPVDLVIIDSDAATGLLAQILQDLAKHHQTRNKSILMVTEEATALSLDFSQGISDFVIKPYSLREIEARLRLLLWNQGQTDDEHTIKVDDMVINQARYEVRVKGIQIELTLKEYELLKHLVTHQGRVFTRGDLLDRIWGYDYYGGMRTVDVHIRRVRSKLGTSGKAVTTVRGVGYKFDFPSA